MSNNIYNLKNIPSMPERVLSALAYLTFGIVGIILLIASALMKIELKSFVKLNVYQSILLGFILGFLQLTYGLISAIFHCISYIPFIGNFINSFFQFIIYYLMGFPILFGFSILSLFILLLIFYLIVMTLIGKAPYIPFLSDIIQRQI